MSQSNALRVKQRVVYNTPKISHKLKLVDEFLSLPKPRNMTAFAKKHGISPGTMHGWLKSHEQGSLRPVPNEDARFRVRKSPYEPVENLLVNYIQLRKKLLSRDKIGLSVETLQQKAIEFAAKILSPEASKGFRASRGFIWNLLNRHELVGVSLHGEKNEVSEEEAEDLMRPFRVELEELVSKYSIPLERIFNADQFGLFFQKLPNRIYCNKKERRTIRGVKQMKDKNRISSMCCVSAACKKLPLPVIEKSKRPQCWDLCEDKPPLPYENQVNSWFDSRLNRWSLTKQFLPYYKKALWRASWHYYYG
jgi:hypothetical protein